MRRFLSKGPRRRGAWTRLTVLGLYLVATAGFMVPAACGEEAGGCCCHEAGDASAAECCCCAVTFAGEASASSLNRSETQPVISGDSGTCATATSSGFFVLAKDSILVQHFPVECPPVSYQCPEFEAHKAPVSLRGPPYFTTLIV